MRPIVEATDKGEDLPGTLPTYIKKYVSKNRNISEIPLENFLRPTNEKSVVLPPIRVVFNLRTLATVGLFGIVDYAKKAGMTKEAFGRLLSSFGTAGCIDLLVGFGGVLLGCRGCFLYKVFSNSKFNKNLKENDGR